ncbi:receptor-like serine/threonine-protein kinase ALE2 isoform X2 [Cajanus cajan]|uniref:Serine/threonine-protein kinase PBS1 n=1 Tax=Cajanus cajan TaxID=3821 RepID=A0A151SHK4_CAJCA|nr:receptor-like serine/threonine-protein kinase ALE2 isoform X2 [Cajanus cajan]KYP54334.1 Serine/threonine-protein kinase PBS1 [Cajanus cajan]
MGLKLIFLLFKLHLVVSTQQLHEHAATKLLHSSDRSHFKIAIPPSKSSSEVHSSIAQPPSESSSGVPASIAFSPSKSIHKAPTVIWTHGSVDSPVSHHKHHHSKRKFRNPTPAPTYPVQAPTYSHQGPSNLSQPPFSSSNIKDIRAPAPAPSPTDLPDHVDVPSSSPRISPLGSSLKKEKAPPPAYALVLPPPPPNKDCLSLTCSEPLTYTPPGSPCGCVWPLQVKLHINIAIYKFFPLVSQLAKEIAASVLLKHTQVRIVGADAASQQLEKTTVLIDLVPKGVKFDDTTAFLIYKKFWHREILIDASVFGAYEVLYVHYPGLPPSPPSTPSDASSIDDGPNPGHDNNGMMLKPLGVDVSKKKKEGSNGRIILIIVLSSITALVLFIGLAWLCLLKCRAYVHEHESAPDGLISSSSKQSRPAGSLAHGTRPSSGSRSFNFGTITYTGSAKIFTLNDLEKATNNFDSSRILGEGGFGVVYKGILNDGRDVAVKILKRDDHRGGREFLAEVEMLSRLHHRNLVKLIGICIEKQTRCLVYELVPNGSVESHLHGADKETDPLDWNSRMKIALGAARGLAYLHEDSNPCVIHRDFKASNILLECDFTPKVSDFGLARTALDEKNKHISTHVMGTFGYLAPEYAMTGHLLVKSDVYSYGVVLLELLTGRKPVDLSQPPGQENLVTWARPLLTSKEGLQMIIDPFVKPNISVDTVVKVAAIASMCVQPEVSQRPFMGEVVQALKLVCSEFEETDYIRSKSFQEEGLLTDVEGRFSEASGERVEFSEYQKTLSGYQSGEEKVTLSASELLGTSGQEFESFRRYSRSGPLTIGKKRQFWQKLRSLSRGSSSEHGFSTKLWPGSH